MLVFLMTPPGPETRGVLAARLWPSLRGAPQQDVGARRHAVGRDRSPEATTRSRGSVEETPVSSTSKYPSYCICFPDTVVLGGDQPLVETTGDL